MSALNRDLDRYLENAEAAYDWIRYQIDADEDRLPDYVREVFNYYIPAMIGELCELRSQLADQPERVDAVPGRPLPRGVEGVSLGRANNGTVSHG